MNDIINGTISGTMTFLVMKLMADNGYRGWGFLVSMVVLGLVWFVLEFKDFCLKG